MNTSTQSRATTGKVLTLAVLLAALAASLVLAAKPSYASTTFTVNSTADHADANLGIGACDTGYTVTGAGGEPEVECTLRAAIQQANYTSGADTINFAIPGSGVKTIAPSSDLPIIIEAVTIDGYTQPGTSANTKAVGNDAVLKIELSGTGVSDGVGLVIGAADSTVKGLVVNRWRNRGILISGSGAAGNKVVGNFIGTDSTGTQKLGNGICGVNIVNAPDNTVGGATAAERNVISGNTLDGLSIYGPDAQGNRVVGNYLGTDASGTKDLGNGQNGVYIYGAPNNTVGGATSGERNVVSGNDYHGVYIHSSGASGNRVAGNYLGTDATGTKDLGNDLNGVFIEDAPNNTVGGTTSGERNVVSGNDLDGVLISRSAATGNRVAGNFVGTDKNGAADLGNGYEGVRITSASNNTVGGTTAARNVISHNGNGVVIENAGATGNRVMQNVVSANDEVGVAVYNGGATGNRILSNSIFANFGLGIDLFDDGPTANDPGDKDTGANGLQNKPVLSSAKKSAAGTTTVRGTLNSTPGKTFTVQFFSNPKGTNEGKTLLGSKSVSTNGTGNVSFPFSTQKAIRLGQNITATATNASTGDTSEFSGPRKVVAQ